MREKLRHIFNPLKLRGLLRRLGLSRSTALALAWNYETYIYRGLGL